MGHRRLHHRDRGLLVVGGGLADRYGRRRVFLAGYAVFGAASLLAAFSPTTEFLIGARALMGVGAAASLAPALAIVAGLYPPEKRAKAIAVWSMFGATGLALGPILGGLLLERFAWSSVFLVVVPLVAVGVVAGRRAIPESFASDRGRLDIGDALISVLGLGLLMFGIIEGPARGWLAPSVIIGLVGGVALLAAFGVRQLRSTSPLLDVRILTVRAVAAGALALFIAYMGFNSMLFLVPQYLTDVEAESSVVVGFMMVPFALAFGVASMRAGWVMGHLGARATITGGLGVMALGLGALSIALGAPVIWIPLTTGLIGLGLSLLITPASTVIMNALPADQAGDGSSLSMVSRFVGAAIGVAVLGSVFTSVYARKLGGDGTLPASGVLDSVTAAAFSDAAQAAFVVIGTIGILSALATWFMLLCID